MKSIIGDARIVVIGEQNHGVGTDYESFALLAQWLHEEMGFNVIAQEYSFFDVGRINKNWKNGGSVQQFRKSMYWPQGKAAEQDLLFDYIDAQQATDKPIIMEGFDPRIFQRKTYYKFFDSLLTQSMHSPLLPVEQLAFQLSTLNNVLTYEYNDTLTSASDQQVFIDNMETIIANMTSLSFAPRLIQLMKNTTRFAKNAWNKKGYTKGDRYYEREYQMAENIIWLSEVIYPTEKIIVHLHNGHAAKNIYLLEDAIPDLLVKLEKNTGSLLHSHFGDACFHIATTYYSGTYCKWDYNEKIMPKPATNSLESKLHKKGYSYAFVKPKAKRKFSMFHSEFNDWVKNGYIKAPFGSIFDAIIFIDQVAMPTEMIEKK